MRMMFCCNYFLFMDKYAENSKIRTIGTLKINVLAYYKNCLLYYKREKFSRAS